MHRCQIEGLALDLGLGPAVRSSVRPVPKPINQKIKYPQASIAGISMRKPLFINTPLRFSCTCNSVTEYEGKRGENPEEIPEVLSGSWTLPSKHLSDNKDKDVEIQVVGNTEPEHRVPLKLDKKSDQEDPLGDRSWLENCENDSKQKFDPNDAFVEGMLDIFSPVGPAVTDSSLNYHNELSKISTPAPRNSSLKRNIRKRKRRSKSSKKCSTQTKRKLVENEDELHDCCDTDGTKANKVDLEEIKENGPLLHPLSESIQSNDNFRKPVLQVQHKDDSILESLMNMTEICKSCEQNICRCNANKQVILNENEDRSCLQVSADINSTLDEVMIESDLENNTERTSFKQSNIHNMNSKSGLTTDVMVEAEKLNLQDNFYGLPMKVKELFRNHRSIDKLYGKLTFCATQDIHKVMCQVSSHQAGTHTQAT